jgi:hypothetical protein
MDSAQTTDLIRFTDVMSARLTPWLERLTATTRRAREPAERLRRAAHRLLSLGSQIGAGGDASHADRRPELVFWYVSLLESLTVTETDKGDLSRKVSQRAAVLLGADDDERVAVARTIATAYSVRSTVAHGSAVRKPDLEALVPTLYDYLRRTLCRLIILGPDFDPATECDTALLSVQARDERIHEPVAEILAQVTGLHRPVPAAPVSPIPPA